MGQLSSSSYKRDKKRLAEHLQNKEMRKYLFLSKYMRDCHCTWDKLPTLFQWAVVIFGPVYFLGPMVIMLYRAVFGG